MAVLAEKRIQGNGARFIVRAVSLNGARFIEIRRRAAGGSWQTVARVKV